MKKFGIISFFILIVFLSQSVKAQTYSISGTVLDSRNKPLIGANVIITNTLTGTATDQRGNFLILGLRGGKYSLKISMVGYETNISEQNIDSHSISGIVIKLNSVTYQAGQVIVSAGKYEQNLIDLPVSASLISADQISKKNHKTLDEAIRDVPGVSVTLDQVSIRGSSGYSRGAGSRVFVAFDGIPIYTGDTGEIIWELIPVNEIDRIEIIKGATSSLYGSTAIGGVINILSKKISSTPLTFVKSYIGVYDNPAHDQWRWDNKIRSYNGLTVSHTQKIGKLGISASVYRTENYSYRQNDYDKLLGGYFKLSYNFTEKSALDIWGTGYARQRESFLYWQDFQNILVPPSGDIGDSQPSNRHIVGLTYNHVISDQFVISIKPSVYRTFWRDDSESSNNSTSFLYRAELQGIYKFDEKLTFINGLETQFGSIKSNIFGNRNSESFGLFSQFEYNFKIPFKVTAGARYSYSKLDGFSAESSLSPKLGINYKISPIVVLRGSVGTGFRAPTLAEAYTSTTTSGLSIKPNPNIKSENNISFETGINYQLNENYNLDLAIYHNEYYNFIEPVLDPLDTKITFENITRARIQGIELNLKSSYFDNTLNINLGYNYLYPRDIELNKDLNYRSRHQVIASAEWNVDIFTIGAGFRYLSRIKEINNELVDFGLIPNGDKRVDIKVLDLRFGANLFTRGFPLRIYLNAYNILNYTYVEMIGNVAPIRNFSVNAEWLF